MLARRGGLVEHASCYASKSIYRLSLQFCSIIVLLHFWGAVETSMPNKFRFLSELFGSEFIAANMCVAAPLKAGFQLDQGALVLELVFPELFGAEFDRELSVLELATFVAARWVPPRPLSWEDFQCKLLLEPNCFGSNFGTLAFQLAMRTALLVSIAEISR